MNFFRELRVGLLKVIFSKRFIRYRYYWTVALTAPMVADITLEVEAPNPILERKSKKAAENRAKELDKIMDGYTNDEWTVMSNRAVAAYPK